MNECKDENDFASLDRIVELLLDIDKNGNEIGIDKPEKLYRESKFIGWYSRRIGWKNRLIYKVENNTIYVLYCKRHYKDRNK